MGALDLFFPKRCVFCRKTGDYLCPNCFARVSFDVSPRCLICQRPSINGLTHPVCSTKYSIDGCFSGVVYKGVVKKLLYQFKYQPNLSDLQSFLGELLYESLIQDETFMQVKSLYAPTYVPIPLSSKKFRARGYNQAALLAKALAKLTEGEVVQLLQRTRDTKPQYGLSKEERAQNMQGAFGIDAKVKSSTFAKASEDKHNPKMQNIFLVDDVVTTGSTLVEAANVLKRNGVQNVWGITFAQD